MVKLCGVLGEICGEVGGYKGIVPSVDGGTGDDLCVAAWLLALECKVTGQRSASLETKKDGDMEVTSPHVDQEGTPGGPGDLRRSWDHPADPARSIGDGPVGDTLRLGRKVSKKQSYSPCPTSDFCMQPAPA